MSLNYKMNLLIAVLFCSIVVFSASEVHVDGDGIVGIEGPLLDHHRTNLEITREIQNMMRRRMYEKAIRDKKLGVVKLMNHLKNRLFTVPFKFNYMAFKPALW